MSYAKFFLKIIPKMPQCFCYFPTNALSQQTTPSPSTSICNLTTLSTCPHFFSSLILLSKEHLAKQQRTISIQMPLVQSAIMCYLSNEYRQSIPIIIYSLSLSSEVRLGAFSEIANTWEKLRKQ